MITILFVAFVIVTPISVAVVTVTYAITRLVVRCSFDACSVNTLRKRALKTNVPYTVEVDACYPLGYRATVNLPHDYYDDGYPAKRWRLTKTGAAHAGRTVVKSCDRYVRRQSQTSAKFYIPSLNDGRLEAFEKFLDSEAKR